ncbi:sodium ion-translocating decarboxylase subunit beta, partial [Lacrimispora saccharolytica]|nr:sodium ion-translocating decarboxylase subunit beta [Lacrimispora saccharolytica]
ENGKLTELQIPEVSYGDSVTEENSSTDEPDEATTEDDLASAAVIGGADGPTSIFLAGKLGS